GIRVAPAVTIQGAKALADGSASDVKSLRGKVVTAVFPDCVYVQEQNSPFGIKLVTSASVTAGEEVDVCGVMKGSGSERYLDCTGNPVMTTSPGPGVPGPISFPNACVGGTDLNLYTPGVLGGLGPNNIGAAANVYGRISAVGSGFFYLDDGSGVIDPRINPATGQPYAGGKVISSEFPGLNEYWTASGISSMEPDGAFLIRTMRATSARRLQ
ncbi:MAG: hypothetical protein Q7T82_10525, partial [Armatimonadota bacterium]|nr:hypothetical protein [Armatimonadota bacterium]